jgi:hypothetical protein
VRISLFTTCYNDTLFPETGKAVVAVLERLGHLVEFRRECRSGRRHRTLEGDVVETVSESLCHPRVETSALITTISGPSATADIEMTRIKGVHGPRTLDVGLVVSDRPEPLP